MHAPRWRGWRCAGGRAEAPSAPERRAADARRSGLGADDARQGGVAGPASSSARSAWRLEGWGMGPPDPRERSRDKREKDRPGVRGKRPVVPFLFLTKTAPHVKQKAEQKGNIISRMCLPKRQPAYNCIEKKQAAPMGNTSRPCHRTAALVTGVWPICSPGRIGTALYALFIKPAQHAPLGAGPDQSRSPRAGPLADQTRRKVKCTDSRP